MEQLQKNKKQMEKLATVLKSSQILTFEYHVDDDTLLIYDDMLRVTKKITNYLDYIDHKSKIHPEDREKVKHLYMEGIEKPLEIRQVEEDGSTHRVILKVTKFTDEDTGKLLLVGSVRDITQQREEEKRLKEEARQDSLTHLFNRTYGKKLINRYLNSKNPFEGCGMIILDIDYFKSINDRYGHLFGDEVIVALSRMLKEFFDKEQSVIMRAGGDEFVIFVKNTTNMDFVGMNVKLIESVRNLKFHRENVMITCSAGVCYLPENVSGYTYDKLFENADMALYKAKEKGRNRYVYCDSLQYFPMLAAERSDGDDMIEARYFQNDITATAFEIFEKSSDFETAIQLLLKVIGIKLGLDRIAIIQTDVKDQEVYCNYQWTNEGVSEILHLVAKFSKEDFIQVFNNYDESGVLVLHYDEMDEYSKEARELLIQNGTKTAVYISMYCGGHYTGAISYVTCKQKRTWSNEMLKQLSEVTKIISAHFMKNEMMNQVYYASVTRMEHDTLTGLISFGKFHEEVERLILSNKNGHYLMIYTDFENFKYFNYKYGYTTGDQLLKEFCGFLIANVQAKRDRYFTRVVSDQFLMFRQTKYTKDEYKKIVKEAREINRRFIEYQNKRFPKSNIALRTGIYYITSECMSASVAIDAANYARMQVKKGEKCGVRFYDELMQKQRILENQIINDMKEAMEQRQFKVFLQPKYSIKEQTITGAEALIRWERENGEILSPSAFVPIYENDGKIIELDYYAFETVVKFIAESLKRGRKQVPISVNASSLHAAEPKTLETYMNILKKYDVDPSYVEIELTETAIVSDYQRVCDLFDSFRANGIKTAMDDFGSGYSILNTVVDTPVDVIKIDRGFINSCLDSDRGIYFLKHLIDMIRNLGYQIICEGVETEEQLSILKQIGCDEIQGFWYSEPLKMEDYEKLLQTEKISNGEGGVSKDLKIHKIYLHNED